MPEIEWPKKKWWKRAGRFELVEWLYRRWEVDPAKAARWLYMLGPRFSHVRKGDGWWVGFGFYWFAMFYAYRLDPELMMRSTVGSTISLYWKVNRVIKEGEKFWLKAKHWTWR